MGSFQSRLGALGEVYADYLSMSHASNEGITCPCSVDDPCGDGFQLLVSVSVAAIDTVAAQSDKNLVDA